MDEKPIRRWFSFRLSTVLILTAILAWGMSIPLFYRYQTPGGFSPPQTHYIFNRTQFLPGLAMVAFLAWRVARAFGPQIVRRRPFDK